MLLNIFYFHVRAVKIHHRDNAEHEKDTAPFMVQLFIMKQVKQDIAQKPEVSGNSGKLCFMIAANKKIIQNLFLFSYK